MAESQLGNSAQLENLGRDLPYSREAEIAVIGSILADGNSIAEAAEIVVPEDFYFVNNREIYSAALELFNDNQPIDFVLVGDVLKRKGKYELAGGTEYMRSIAMEVSTSQNVSYYAHIIRDKAMLRTLISKATEITALAYDESDKPDKLIDRAEQLISDVSSSMETNDIQHIGGVLVNTYQQLIENSQAKGGITGIPTGFDELNRRTGGFHGGELILIAGRPGMGKSSFAVNIAEYISFHENQCVAIFNLEMPKEQIVNRILCSQALVNSIKMRTGDLEPDDWLKLGEVIPRISNSPMYIDDTATITVAQIRAKCRRLKQTKNLSLIVIDYLQLMQSGRRSESRQQEISDISRSLKILAKELNVPVIALSQLSRASEKRPDKRPMLSDLRESGAIEQDADMVMFLYRDEYYNENSEDKNLAECIIAKHRSGETGTFKLGWKGEYTKFSNVEYALKEE